MTAPRLGKMPTTSVRRRISRFRRSWGLLLQIWRQCTLGNSQKASRSEATSVRRSAAAGNPLVSSSTTRACWALVEAASGWAKIVRTSVATRFWADLGTLVSRLRMKWVLCRRRHNTHKVANVLNALPKSAQPARKALAEIRDAEDKDHATRAIHAFSEAFAIKYPKV